MNTFTTHPRKLILFTALSLADLVLTCFLLQRGGGRVYEGNPVADWWLDAWGWTGLVAFKVLAVVLATVLTAAISRRRPALGGKVLVFACTVVAGVLLYSCALAGKVRPDDCYRRAAARAEWLDRQLKNNQQFFALMLRMGQDLLSGRRTLTEAVAELARTQRGRDPELLLLLRRRNPDCSDRALLAISLMETAVELVAEMPARGEEVFQRLRVEYQANFGKRVLTLAWILGNDLSGSPPQALIREL